jgi:hypothetical protein
MAREHNRSGKDLLFRPPNKDSANIGTVQALDNAIACCRKGCYESRFTFAESYILVGRSKQYDLPIFHSIGHTGKNEALHSVINRLLDYISNIKDETIERRLALLIFFYNWRKDVELNVRRGDDLYPWQEAMALAPGAQPLVLDPNTIEPMGWALKSAHVNAQLAEVISRYNTLVPDGSDQRVTLSGGYTALLPCHSVSTTVQVIYSCLCIY